MLTREYSPRAQGGQRTAQEQRRDAAEADPRGEALCQVFDSDGEGGPHRHMMSPLTITVDVNEPTLSRTIASLGQGKEVEQVDW